MHLTSVVNNPGKGVAEENPRPGHPKGRARPRGRADSSERTPGSMDVSASPIAISHLEHPWTPLRGKHVVEPRPASGIPGKAASGSRAGQPRMSGFRASPIDQSGHTLSRCAPQPLSGRKGQRMRRITPSNPLFPSNNGVIPTRENYSEFISSSIPVEGKTCGAEG
jgi:hypothetical protein